MKRFFLVMFGLALIAICASWFLGIFDSAVTTVTSSGGIEPAPGSDNPSSLRSTRGKKSFFGRIDVNTVLNFANALIGVVGLMVTYKASRPSAVKSDTTSA